MKNQILVTGCILSMVVTGSACDVEIVGESDDGSDLGTIDSHASALSLPGVDIVWNYVGNPSDASKIAVCADGVIYALNNDHGLWSGDGSDSDWRYRGFPYQARDIGCPVVGYAYPPYALNADKTFYRGAAGSVIVPWVYEGSAPSAIAIGSAEKGFMALNGDGSVYQFNWYDKQFHYMASFPGATDVTAGDFLDIAGGDWRFFVIKNGDVQFATRPAGDGSTTALTPLPLWSWDHGRAVKKRIRDISALNNTELWALTEDRTLYRADFTETACLDSEDNDLDGHTNGFDSDCHDYLGQLLCTEFARSGSFCIDRVIGHYSNALVVCNGSTLVRTEAGRYCRRNNDADGQDRVYGTPPD